MAKTPKINQTFICQNCGHKNPPHQNSCRNHCRNCLYSLHLDENLPGDRKSNCEGMMEPVKAGLNSKKGWMIYHKCQKCGKMIPNKAAPDDDFSKIIMLSLYESATSKKTRTRNNKKTSSLYQ